MGIAAPDQLPIKMGEQTIIGCIASHDLSGKPEFATWTGAD
jgi:hypothetical protein